MAGTPSFEARLSRAPDTRRKPAMEDLMNDTQNKGSSGDTTASGAGYAGQLCWRNHWRTAMSDTPRTDTAEAFDDDGRVVTASFARTLERELAKAVAALEFIRDAGGTTSDDAEFGQINYNGSWCAEQARAALYSIANERSGTSVPASERKCSEEGLSVGTVRCPTCGIQNAAWKLFCWRCDSMIRRTVPASVVIKTFTGGEPAAGETYSERTGST